MTTPMETKNEVAQSCDKQQSEYHDHQCGKPFCDVASNALIMVQVCHDHLTPVTIGRPANPIFLITHPQTDATQQGPPAIPMPRWDRSERFVASTVLGVIAPNLPIQPRTAHRPARTSRPGVAPVYAPPSNTG